LSGSSWRSANQRRRSARAARVLLYVGLPLAAAMLVGGCADSSQPAAPAGDRSSAAVKAEPAAADRAAQPPTSTAPVSPAPVVTGSAPKVSVSTARREPKSPGAAARSDGVVTASAVVDRSTVHAGDTFTIRVEAHIETGWHIYAIDRPTGPSIPTSIDFKLPKAMTWEGDWSGPEPTLDDAHPQEPAFYYEGAAAFTRAVRVAKDAPAGSLGLEGALHYQACNQTSCRAPTQEPVRAEIQIVH
jgi:uncharacterized protein